MKVKLALSLILALLAFALVTQNTEVVRVVFLAWSVEMSLVVLILIVLGGGMVIGWALNSYLRYSRNRRREKTLTPGGTIAVPVKKGRGTPNAGNGENNEREA